MVEIFEVLLEALAQPRVASEDREVLTQIIPSAAAKLLRDLRETTGEDNPVLTEMDPLHITAVAAVEAKDLQR